MTNILFLHGLDSSSQGTKGRYFSELFPEIVCLDFSGSLEQRLSQLEEICRDLDDIVLIGSSFGGLMATSFAIKNPLRVSRLILLAPALNFADFTPPIRKVSTPTLVVMGDQDTVCPPALVLPLAKDTFADLEIQMSEDDHLLRTIFQEIEWQELLR
jgi:pimeloyl-ACP methyl ester carboxylesterase